MFSIVVPTYNRGHHLLDVRNAIHDALEEEKISYELIFVNDGSADATDVELEKLSRSYENVKGISLLHNYGQQNATLAGIRYVGYPYVVTFDDDLSYDPKSIVALFNILQQGYDVVYGVHDTLHRNPLRNLGTWGKELMFFLLLNKPLGVRLTSFRIMTREVAEFVAKDHSSGTYISARILKMTGNIGNVLLPRQEYGNRSNYTLWKLIKLLAQVIMNYTVLSKVYRNHKEKKQYTIKEIFG